MKKLIVLSLVAAAFAAPAFAADDSMSGSSMSNGGMSNGMSSDSMSMTKGAAKRMQMKDGSWAKVMPDNAVKVSKDNGKTWMPAPDGTWEMKDGSSVTTKGGKVAM